MGCEGCFISAKGQAAALDTIKREAKKYAVENKQTVAIYKEANDYFFAEAGAAISAGKPVMEFVSQFNRDKPQPLD